MIFRKKKPSRLIYVALILILTLFVIIYFWFINASRQIFIGKNKLSFKNADIIDEHFKKKTPFNILLLGYGGGYHEGAYLTDSMIIVQINPLKQKIYLISIPRDLWVKNRKINAIFQTGLENKTATLSKNATFNDKILYGGNISKSILQTITGLPIEKFIAIDFTGFTKSVDVLGGVDINIENTFDDFEYPVTGKEKDLCGRDESELPELVKIATNSPLIAFPCRYEHLHFDAGMTHLDGEMALKYVRSRHSLQDGTDFGRSKRQLNLLMSVKQKVLTIGFLPRILPFINSLQEDFKTDLSLDETKILLTYTNELDKYQVINVALSNDNILKDSFSQDGQYILIPQAGLDRWDKLQSWLKNELDPIHIATPSSLVR